MNFRTKSEDVPKEHICSHCTKYVYGGIRCERCDYWYHKICEGLSEDAGQTELKKIDYICTFCNDDILYERRHDIPEEVDIDQHNMSNEDLSLTELKQPATVQGKDADVSRPIEIVKLGEPYTPQQVKTLNDNKNKKQKCV